MGRGAGAAAVDSETGQKVSFLSGVDDDETSFVKAGTESVGVSRQHCGAVGKTANCQIAVSLYYCAAKVSCPVSWRLYLPNEWAEDPERREKVKIPEEVLYRSRNDLALELVDQMQQ